MRVRPDAEFWIGPGGSELAEALARRLQSRGFGVRLVERGRSRRLPLPTGSTAWSCWRTIRRIRPCWTHSGCCGPAPRVYERLAGPPWPRSLASTARSAWAGLNRPSIRRRGPCRPDQDGRSRMARSPARRSTSTRWDVDSAAEALVNELLRPGRSRSACRTRADDAATDRGAGHARSRIAPLHPGDVVVITAAPGASRPRWPSRLAEAFRPTIVLLGRTPGPTIEPDGSPR